MPNPCGNWGKKKGKSKTTFRGSGGAIKEYSKRLARDPYNIEALQGLGRIYYQNQVYDKAFPLYQKLYGLMATHLEVKQEPVALAFGICAYKLERLEEARGAFRKVLVMNPMHFEANFYTAKILFNNKEFDKALPYIKKASAIDKESAETLEMLGYTLFELKKYHEALVSLRHAIDMKPGDKKMLFYFACALEECSMDDKAIKVFMHLRIDKEFGAEASLHAGKLHDKMGKNEEAIQDYEVGLNIEGITTPIKLDILYNLSQVYIRLRNIQKALYYLQQIASITPNYKDVQRLLQGYGELNQNSNLQLFLMARPSEFIVLCKKVIQVYYKNSYITFISVDQTHANVDIQVSVESSRWTSQELFRFFRTESMVGQLLVTDCYNKIKEIKFDKGYCVSAGSFSEDSKKFCDGRPIDLIDKNDLIKLLKKVKA